MHRIDKTIQRSSHASAYIRRLAAVAAVAVGLTALASPASADLPDRQVVEASSDSNSDPKGKTVYCPNGTRVVGSGADIIGGTGTVVLEELIPTRDTVRAYAYEADNGTTANWEIRAWAVCGNPNGSSVTASRESVRNSNSKPVDVTCPDGKVVLGTGASIEGGQGQVVIDEIIPTTNTVSVLGLEDDDDGDGYGGNWSIRAYAICGDEPGGREIESRTTTATSDDKGTSAPCDPGKIVFGGGFDIGGGAGLTFINDFIPMTDSVQAYATENYDGADGSGRNWSLRSYAICGTA